MNCAALSVVIALITIIGLNTAGTQFWKLNSLSERELFIMETKASMASGICYKDVPFKYADPLRNFKTISFCCSGYVQNTESMGMECDPICTENCKNGMCSSPNVCECYPGFKRVNKQCQLV